MHLDADVSNVQQVADSIQFGLYDALFCWWRGPVLVVCSMGDQSTGKSYQLNHLGGSLFDVSGGRCTDGCWLTAREAVLADRRVLLVMLDCEGLGSWQRTETEDVLLSLVAAALSNATLFKTHFDFNRYTEQTLRRLNLAAPKVKAMCGRAVAGSVFNGKLAFCLKDTPPGEVETIEKEFINKVQTLTQESTNFLTNMFKSGLTIVDFPNIKEKDFYRQLEGVVNTDLEDLPLQFPSGLRFESMTRTLLAKISVKDWTPLDRDYIRKRRALLESNLEDACVRGGFVTEIGAEDGVSPLVNVDTQGEIPDMDLEFPVSLSEPAAAAASASGVRLRHKQGEEDEEAFLAGIDLPDAGLVLIASGEDAGNGNTVSEEVRRVYAKFFPSTSTDRQVYRKHIDNFQSFLRALVSRRSGRTAEWLAANMRDFLDDTEAQALLQRQSTRMNEMRQALTLCSQTCEHCYLGCALSRSHAAQHHCYTDHKCTGGCEYCQQACSDTPTPTLPRCADKAGHSGPHSCGSPEHVCGLNCQLFGVAYNCQQRCRHEPGHEGPCQCGTESHLCGQLCDLPGCGQPCMKPYGMEHERHECGRVEWCPRSCALCNLTCAHPDHFHDLTAPNTLHLCGKPHRCTDPATKNHKNCANPGVCEVFTELVTEETRTFHGARGRFEYVVKPRQVPRRLPCVVPIPAGVLHHEGPCVHSTNPQVFDCCGQPCPACGNLCNLPHGHNGEHNTMHGNMTSTVWVSVPEEQDIDIGTHKYVAGESGIAETCDSYCVSLGRGHVHVIPCVPGKCRSGLHDGHRHAEVEYTDGTATGSAQPKDELTCVAFWQHFNFRNPCQGRAEVAEFLLCPARCGALAHEDEKDDNGEPAEVFCPLPLWHEPCLPGQLPDGEDNGHVSTNGHFFRCEHGAGNALCHTFFIIDRSYSMASTDVKPASPVICNSAYFQGILNSRLGVVYEAMSSYINCRLSLSPKDLVTFIAFDHEAETVFLNTRIDTNGLLDQLLQVLPRGNTNFVAGLDSAYQSLNSLRVKNLCPNHKPIFILLTDSEDWSGDKTMERMTRMMQQELAWPEDARLQLHCVGFGSAVNTRFLQDLAEVGNGVFHDNPTTDDIARMKLVRAFEELAEKPHQRAALIVR